MRLNSMKRRVLRAHANKRNLRLISAVNTVAPGSYNVLCDASFLRAVLLAYNQDAGVHGKLDSATNVTSRCGRRDQGEHSRSANYNSVLSFLRALVNEAFGVLDNGYGHGEDGKSSRHPRLSDRHGANCPNAQLRFYCLPATVGTLRRLMERQESAGAKDDDVSQQGKRNTSHRARHDAARDVEALLSAMKIIQSQPPSTSKKEVYIGAVHTAVDDGMCNEMKAIEKFAHQCYTKPMGCTSMCTPSYKLPNSSFFFIATQSHDVRKQLPGNSALLRLAFKPSCVWIELLCKTYNYSREGAVVVEKKADMESCSQTATSADTSRGVTSKTALLPTADVAFMNYICQSVATKHYGDAKKTAPNQMASHTHTPATSSAITQDVGASPKTPDATVLGVAARRKRCRQHNPNPLSLKKRRSVKFSESIMCIQDDRVHHNQHTLFANTFT